MNWLETIRTGVNGVRSHRLRSSLTVLGILIGIAAVILAVGLGEGAQPGQLRDQRPRLQPADRLARELDLEPGIREALGSASTLTMADATALPPRRRARHQGGGTA